MAQELLVSLALGLYTFLPAYFANGAALAFGGGRPLDGGRLFRDGRPLLGSHKTVRGLLAGILVGLLTGLAQGAPLLGILMGLGAVLGDIAAAFAKRRLSMPPGAPLPVVDQFDFLLGAYLLSLPLLSLAPDSVVLVFIATPVFHVATNYASYLLRIKKVPW